MHPIFIWSWLLLTLSPLFVIAQTVPFEATFYYKTAASILEEEADPFLEEVLSYSQANPDQTIVIQGHTDNKGNPKDNIMLSRARAISLVRKLLEAGIAMERLEIKALGEQYPLYSNQYEAGRKFNRRVEVFITDEVKPIYFSQLYKNNLLKKRMRPKPAQLVIKNPSKETFWTTPKGTKIYIPANAFVGAESQPITLKIREAYEFSTMLLNGLATTSKEGLLTTGGMFELKATNSKGQLLQLHSSKQLGIQVPTDTLLPEMQLYNLDTTSVATLWNTPRPLRAFAANSNLGRGFFRDLYCATKRFDPTECPPLDSLLAPVNLDKQMLLEQVHATKKQWLAYEIPLIKEYSIKAINRALEENEVNQKIISEAYVSDCKNIFCKVGEAFKKKQLVAKAKEAARVKRQVLQEEQATLALQLKEQQSLAKANELEVKAGNIQKKYLYQQYEQAQQKVAYSNAPKISIAKFETLECSNSYPKMPDTLQELANRDRYFAIYYYSKNLDELQVHYSDYESIITRSLYGAATYKEGITKQQLENYMNAKDLESLQQEFPEKEHYVCQTLYQVDTYQEAIREKKYQQYITQKDLKSLQQAFPSREKQVCQLLYGVDTYQEARRKKRYLVYFLNGDIEAVKRNFPSKEQDFCQQLYGVDNFMAAKKEQRARLFLSYCQQCNIELLKRDFPRREQEACQIMFGSNTFAAAKKAKAKVANLKGKFYQLQVDNKALGRWMNLDYLRKGKIPTQEQQVILATTTPIHREDYMIYSNTKAINQPSVKQLQSTSFGLAVEGMEHTLISYYALDNNQISIGTKVFVATKAQAITLTYEVVSLEEFVERLREI